MCAVAFRKTHGQDRMRIFGTEGFVPVTSFCRIFGSPSLFIKCLIGKYNIYDESCTSMQKVFIHPKPVREP